MPGKYCSSKGHTTRMIITVGKSPFQVGGQTCRDSSLLDTALRESAEEIGIDPRDVEILGQSCPITTVTNYEVTPYVAVIPWPYPFSLSKTEVERIITIPAAWLADPINRKTEFWRIKSNPDQAMPVIYFKEYEGDTIWGATAQIVVDFLELIQSL